MKVLLNLSQVSRRIPCAPATILRRVRSGELLPDAQLPQEGGSMGSLLFDPERIEAIRDLINGVERIAAIKDLTETQPAPMEPGIPVFVA